MLRIERAGVERGSVVIERIANRAGGREQAQRRGRQPCVTQRLEQRTEHDGTGWVADQVDLELGPCLRQTLQPFHHQPCAAVAVWAGALGVELHLAPHCAAGGAQQRFEQPVGLRWGHAPGQKVLSLQSLSAPDEPASPALCARASHGSGPAVELVRVEVAVEIDHDPVHLVQLEVRVLVLVHDQAPAAERADRGIGAGGQLVQVAIPGKSRSPSTVACVSSRSGRA